MARITIEDCMKRIPNRFALVHLTAKRVRQMREGSPLLIPQSKNEEVVTALREIAADKIYINDDDIPGIEVYHDY
ncbi:MAG: DNA-directed RNA polymerase subunit omega [Candidatus Magnetoglobus multicellularis str. Araruama]|uniref:DNA-directed RNA polymerase subunit omega n=1 Tax=Candidatus Magnetoglobus multicellularis str. Araruama TaxID=890399 RepID=A0A1V1PDX2_9BACT|nr:MAG: DNA-directed RNA polymerase subunit omega [Candidatus Magnetoglobus multicellularis str. Araruama]